MAKKSRSVTTKSAPTFAGIQRSVVSTESINSDYSTIKSDMKRIGMLAGGFFALLIVLSFFIK
ncbi:MAG: hypothetical protein WCK35_09975 [Chloroflexota bacterium]